jgi:hypothetical protein
VINVSTQSTDKIGCDSMKKLILMIVAVLLIAAFSGCIDINVGDTPISLPEPLKTPKVFSTPEPDLHSEEIELLVQYFTIHNGAFCHETNVKYDEEGGKQYTLVCPEPKEIKEKSIAYEEALNLYNIDVIEVYRQSLILYSPDYGYLYWLSMESDLQPKVRNQWQNIALQHLELVDEYHGEIHDISEMNDFISFRSIEDARGFIRAL